MIYFLLCVAIFTVIGLGPSLYLVAHQRRGQVFNALLLAPVFGLGISALVITNVVYAFDIAIKDYATAFLVGMVGVSLAVTVYVTRKQGRLLRRLLSHRGTWLIIAAAVVTMGLLLLPGEVGGPTYRIWQGNNWDWQNYNLMAFYRQNFAEAEFIARSQHAEIINLEPDLYDIGRPAVAYLLAWFSSLFKVPTYDLTHYYVLALIFILLPSGLALGRLLKFHLRMSIALGMVLAVGFWTFAVADINALSQVSSFAPLLLVVYTWMRVEQYSPDALFSRDRMLLGLSIAFIFTLYPELLPILIVVFAFNYGIRWLDMPSHRIAKQGLNHVVTVLWVLIFCIPTANHTVSYIQLQTSTGANLASDWHLGLFPWLYQNDSLIVNLSGLHFYTASLEHGATALLLASTITLIMTLGVLVVLIGGLLFLLFRPNDRPEWTVLLSLIVAYWGGGLLLNLIGRYWTGGKTLFMGFPFVIVALFLFREQASRIVLTNGGHMQKTMSAAIPLLISLWIVAQIGTPIIRTSAAANDYSIPNYPALHQPMLDDMTAITSRLRTVEQPIVYSDLYSKLLDRKELWVMILSDISAEHIVINSYNYGHAYDDHVPGFLVFSTATDYLIGSNIGSQVSDASEFFSLYAVTPEEVDLSNLLLSITGSPEPRYEMITNNFALPESDMSARWTVTDQAWLRFMASGDTPFALYWRGTPAYDGEMQIILDDTGETLATTDAVNGQQTEGMLCFMPTPGTNNLMFSHNHEQAIAEPERLLIHDIRLVPIVDQLDIGYADLALLNEGWEGTELWGEENVRWANQEASFVHFGCPGDALSGDITLRFRAFLNTDLNLGPQAVTISVNGFEQDTVALEPGWAEYTVTFDPDDLRDDAPQTVTLSHAWSVTPPGDNRELAVAYDWFRLENGDS